MPRSFMKYRAGQLEPGECPRCGLVMGYEHQKFSNLEEIPIVSTLVWLPMRLLGATRGGWRCAVCGSRLRTSYAPRVDDRMRAAAIERTETLRASVPPAAPRAPRPRPMRRASDRTHQDIGGSLRDGTWIPDLSVGRSGMDVLADAVSNLRYLGLSERAADWIMLGTILVAILAAILFGGLGLIVVMAAVVTILAVVDKNLRRKRRLERQSPHDGVRRK